MRGLLLRGLLAGVVAGLVAALFSYVVAEPVLDSAIALEGSSDGEPLVTRTQQKAFLFVAQPLVGAAFGLLFAVAWSLLPRDVALRPFQRGLVLSTTAFGALYLVPFLAYPPSPPGVGDPDTVGDRTSAYLLAVALGLAVATLAYAASRALRRRGRPLPGRALAVAVGTAAVLAFGLWLLPAAAGVPTAVPADLLWDFRVRSFGVQALLWGVLGAVFGALSERAEQTSDARRPAVPRP